MYDRIVKRLEGLGYTVDKDRDEALIMQEMEAVRDFLLASCNLSFIPKVLETAYIDIVCGNILKNRLYGGDLQEAEAQGIASRITEGDVTVEYDTDKEMGYRERIEALADRLLNKKNEIISCRRLKW